MRPPYKHLRICLTFLAACQVPRAAMAILALLLESGRPGLLLPLLSEELRGPSCVQQLVLLAGGARAVPVHLRSVIKSAITIVSADELPGLHLCAMLLNRTTLSFVGPMVLCTGALCMGQSTLGMQGLQRYGTWGWTCFGLLPHMFAQLTIQLLHQALC